MKHQAIPQHHIYPGERLVGILASKRRPKGVQSLVEVLSSVRNPRDHYHVKISNNYIRHIRVLGDNSQVIVRKRDIYRHRHKQYWVTSPVSQYSYLHTQKA